MSVNKWRYTPECDKDYCPGDCDECGKNEEKKMKFPTMKEMATEAAEKALNEYEYKGKTLKQWIDILSSIDTDDIIKRQDAIDSLCNKCSITRVEGRCQDDYCTDVQSLKDLPTVNIETIQ